MTAEPKTPVAQPATTTMAEEQPRVTSPQPTANTNSATQYSYYQPYPGNQFQGPPSAPRPYNLAVPPTLPEAHYNKSWEITKFILNAVVFIFSIVGMAIGLSLLSSKYRPDRSSDDNNGYSYRYYDYNDNSIIFIIIGTPIYVVSILWSGAELITRVARKFKAGIHPGAHVGMYLILWMATASAGGLWATFIAYDSSDDNCPYSSSDYEEYHNCIDSSSSNISALNSVRIADTAFVWIVFVAQFALFVGACVDTNRRNGSRAARLMVMEAQYAAMWNTMAPQQQQQFQQSFGRPQMAQTDYKGPVDAPAGVFHPNNQQHPQPQQPQQPQQSQPAQQPEQQNQRQISEYYSPGTAQ